MILDSNIMERLAARQSYQQYNCLNGYYLSNGQCYRSNWYYWGRWVLAGVVILFFIALLVLLSIRNNRRRRRQGLAPRYGTGWVGGGGNAPKFGPGYNNTPGQNNGQAPPPPYNPNQQGPVPNQYTGQTFDSNEGYYGHHNTDVPLQQPQQSYNAYPRDAENVYEPPAGPPPTKK